jgi:CRISPR-associated protein Csm1
MAHRDEVVLGALLHDVGAFMQRAQRDESALSYRVRVREAELCPADPSGRLTCRHVLWTNEFLETVVGELPEGVDRTLVASLASAHHRPSDPLERLVAYADRLSAGVEREGVEDDAPHPVLESVLTTLATGGTRPPGGGVWEYAIAPLSPEAIFPRRTPRDATVRGGPGEMAAAYDAAWRRLTGRLGDLARTSPLAFTLDLAMLLERHAWCIPAPTAGVHRDVSLYAHLRTSAAIAGALHGRLGDQFPERAGLDEEGIFCLAGIEFAGAADAILALDAEPAARSERLRGRELVVAALAEVASLRLLDAFGMSPLNVLSTSGRRRVLLLPASRDWRSTVAEFAGELDRYCLGRLGAAIRPAVGAIELSPRGLMEFGSALRALAGELDRAAERPFAATLIERDLWDEGRLLLDTIPEWRESGPERAAAERSLGARLSRAAAVALFAEPRCGEIEILGRSIGLVDRGDSTPGEFVLALDDGMRRVDAPALRWRRAQRAPVARADSCVECSSEGSCPEFGRLEPGRPLPFACLAARSAGRKYLGYLRAEVDGFEAALERGYGDGAAACSAARAATAGHLAGYFFADWLDGELAPRGELHVLHAAAGDVLLAGPWDQVIDAAERLRAEFGRAVGRNPALGVSAAVELAGSASPTAMVGERLRAGLAAARAAGGDRIAVLGDVLPWPELGFCLAEAKKLAGWTARRRWPGERGLRTFVACGELYREHARTGSVAALRYLPMLSAEIARGAPATPADRGGERGGVRAWAEGLLDIAGSRVLPRLSLVAAYALAASRGGRDG